MSLDGLGTGHGDWIALLDVEPLFRYIRALDHLFGSCRAAKRNIGTGTERAPPGEVGKRTWSVMQRAHAERIPLAKWERPELCVTEPNCIRQNGLEYRLQVAGRA